MTKFKVLGIDRCSHTSKEVYVEAEDKQSAISIAYHIPFYIPIRAIEI